MTPMIRAVVWWFQGGCYRCGAPLKEYTIPYHHGEACPSCEPRHFR